METVENWANSENRDELRVYKELLFKEREFDLENQ